MDAHEIIDALEYILASNLHTIIINFIIGAVVLMLIKITADNIAGYILYRNDKHLAIGSAVEVYGQIGRIKNVTIFTITVETKSGYIRIPIKDWRNCRYIALKDNLDDIKHRRQGDD